MSRRDKAKTVEAETATIASPSIVRNVMSRKPLRLKSPKDAAAVAARREPIPMAVNMSPTPDAVISRTGWKRGRSC
jgi:hypothetical protein